MASLGISDTAQASDPERLRTRRRILRVEHRSSEIAAAMLGGGGRGCAGIGAGLCV